MNERIKKINKKCVNFIYDGYFSSSLIIDNFSMAMFTRIGISLAHSILYFNVQLQIFLCVAHPNTYHFHTAFHMRIYIFYYIKRHVHLPLWKRMKQLICSLGEFILWLNWLKQPSRLRIIYQRKRQRFQYKSRWRNNNEWREKNAHYVRKQFKRELNAKIIHEMPMWALWMISHIEKCEL